MAVGPGIYNSERQAHDKGVLEVGDVVVYPHYNGYEVEDTVEGRKVTLKVLKERDVLFRRETGA